MFENIKSLQLDYSVQWSLTVDDIAWSGSFSDDGTVWIYEVREMFEF